MVKANKQNSNARNGNDGAAALSEEKSRRGPHEATPDDDDGPAGDDDAEGPEVSEEAAPVPGAWMAIVSLSRRRRKGWPTVCRR